MSATDADVQAAWTVVRGGAGLNTTQMLRAILDAVALAIAARALRDAAETWASDPDSVGDSNSDARNWLRDRADEIERTA